MNKINRDSEYNIGANIANLRRANNMTQEALAAELQKMGLVMSQSQLAHIEAGRQNAGTAVLVGLKIIFGCDYGDFFKGFEARLKSSYQ